MNSDQKPTIENKVLLENLRSLAGITFDRFYANAFKEAADRIDELERHLAEAREDQERFEFIKSKYRVGSLYMNGKHGWVPGHIYNLLGGTFEEAIDAAIAQQKVKS
jgi:hypothetical protein